MATVLVTGGCGFVGRHLSLRLLRDGHQVWIVDTLRSGQHPDTWVPRQFVQSHCLHFIHGDVRDVFLHSVLPPFDDVYHLAAVIGGRSVIEGDPMAVAEDLSIDADFFRWAVLERPHRILYASSSAAYPVALQNANTAQALKESSLEPGEKVGQPDFTYGWAKMTGEYLARVAAQRYGLHVACVRPFSGYGEDQDDSYPIPAIAARVAKREDPLAVWGPGTQVRDFIHIDDCIDAMMLALAAISDGTAVNIGSGTPTTFVDIARMLASLAGYEPLIVTQKDKPVGVHTRYADMSYCKRLLRWSPAVSLEEGMRRVLTAALRNTKTVVRA